MIREEDEKFEEFDIPEDQGAIEYKKNLQTKYKIIKECYKKAEHFINLASNSLSIFENTYEKKILEI